jgi:putative peptide zinc metalloprotease protein
MLTDAPRSFGPSSVRARLRRGFGDLMNIRLGLLPGERLLQAVAAALGAIPSSLRRGLGALLLLNGLLAPAFVLVLRGPEVLALGPVPGRHLLVLAGLLALEVVLHELAHGVALTMCGGRVKEFGVGLQYLIRPYSYTNTTDGYRLSRRARLVVSLAGPAVELVLLGLSAQLLWMVPPGSAAAQILPLLMATEVSLLLFNVNPLLPVDGYYVLADLLKEPALRAESLSYWLSIPARLTGHERRAYSTRQHLTYVGYGILSTVYLVAVLGATLLTIWIVVDPLAKPRLLAAVPALRPWWP